MSMLTLAIAATGMSAQEQNLEVIANNIANINTTGFKRSRAEFTDLMYQSERLMGVSNRGRDATIPEGAQLGLGVRTAAIRSLNIQGSLTNTGNTLDLAVNGRGWFQVTMPDSTIAYTRDGAFNTNGTGQLVTSDGYLVTPPIQIPINSTNVTVSQTGLVTATVPGQVAPQSLGQLTLANFVNEAGLLQLGSNLTQQTLASGPPTVSVPGDTSFGTLQQGYLESSNVDPVSEITNLIAAQRAYEMNSKVIQAADQMSSTITNIRQ
jgi:flagellar basal-body rod protein FlgG